MLIDPVCEKRMNRGRAYVIIEHEGVAYSLCCPLCQAEFERSPEAYAKPEWGRPVKQKEKKGRRSISRRRH